MIRISQLKLAPAHTEQELVRKLCGILHIAEEQIKSYSIRKQSIDARKKEDINYVYTVDVAVLREAHILKKCHGKYVEAAPKMTYRFPVSGTQKLDSRPVIIGSGPAGLFCTYMLALSGYKPLLLERGADIDQRTKDVEKFWNEGALNPESNVQFGEGGAGTFSDGKLNTLVKDPGNRNQKVLEVLVEHGAPEEILYLSKPHIGTDILKNVVKNIRRHIITLGGEVCFNSKVTDIHFQDMQKVTGVEVNGGSLIAAQLVILAIGHSARDTFDLLYQKAVPMEAKSFAVGVRIEHPQALIQESQYGIQMKDMLPAASYKLASQLENGRNVYSFCMCPGGYVVNAASQEHGVAVNGMSYHDRAGNNANSAIVVTVTPDDFESSHPLAGVSFQRKLEEKAYAIGNGKIPVQCFRDYCSHASSTELGTVIPQTKGAYQPADVRSIFSEEIGDSIEQGILNFDKKIHNFATGDAIISGVESRTSSPVRILRNADFESSISGLYPCGEGAGYAGGIVSAAMDGLKVAETIAADFTPCNS